MFRVPGYGNPPVKGCTGYAQIFQTAFDKGNHFVAAGFRLNEIRVFIDELQPAVRIIAHLEEISFFRNEFQRAAAIRADVFAFGQFIFRPERFTGSAVPAFVFSFINISLVIGFLHQGLRHFDMIGISRTDKAVMGNVQFLPEFFEKSHDAVNIFLRLHSLAFSGTLDFLTMFIRSGSKKDVIAAETMEPGQCVGNSRAVRVTDMQFGTRIINRGGNKILLLVCHGNSSSAGK